jgi:hypothetical protein
MIIKCNKIISQTTGKDLGDESSWLKKGDQYLVLALTLSRARGLHVFIQTNHYDEPGFFSLDGFEMISQHIPTAWITHIENIANDQVVTMLPESWNYPDFFEEISDENPKAVQLYNQEVEKLYKEEGWLE